MKSNEVREKFLKFFEKRGHTIIPSASLVPENDPSALFNSAGMQPLVPYLMGQKHPSGDKLVNVQKCIRTTDIDEVGDNTHLTFFEMLGNWGLADAYWKKDAIKWSYELLTSKDEGFGLDPSRLYVTVFEGNENAPQDKESAKIWQELEIPESRIYFLSAQTNWWQVGDSGPSGPDTEMFFDVTESGLGDLGKEEFIKAEKEGKVVEVWNDVFMEYEMKDGKVIGKLKQKNVDTGAGLERLAMVLQKKKSVYETDLMANLISEIKEGDAVAKRIIADHVKAATLMIADGVLPSNTDRGYVLRRLIRRAVRYNQDVEQMMALIDKVAESYKDIYSNLEKTDSIKEIFVAEVEKFKKTLDRGLKEFKKIEGDVSGQQAFKLFATYGFPIELTEELAEERGIKIDRKEFEKEMAKHQEISRTATAGKFKGGLADHGQMAIKYHTVSHLLHQALRQVLGDHVEQRGSNITEERARFDFSHPQKMTDEEKKKVEGLVNEKIKEALPVTFQEMSLDEAKKIGALGVFDSKYGDKVRVYTIGDSGSPFNVEICGGPHVESTGELGHFKIKKEEASSAGVRRIKAVLK